MRVIESERALGLLVVLSLVVQENEKKKEKGMGIPVL
jgi:hypothetical protein